MLHFLGKTVKVLVSLLLLSVAGLFVFSLMPIPGNIETKIVKSGSMEPEIHVGALVVIKPEESFTVGQVITFGADTKREIPTTHRIVGIREAPGGPYYTTKGDANEEADTNEVAKKDVIGRVLFNVPYIGRVLDFAKQPIGFVFLIVLPSALIIFDELVGIWKEITKRRREKAETSYDAT